MTPTYCTHYLFITHTHTHTHWNYIFILTLPLSHSHTHTHTLKLPFSHKLELHPHTLCLYVTHTYLPPHLAAKGIFLFMQLQTHTLFKVEPKHHSCCLTVAATHTLCHTHTHTHTHTVITVGSHDNPLPSLTQASLLQLCLCAAVSQWCHYLCH